MSLPPQKFREMVFQMLYSCDFTQESPAEIVEMLMNELKVTRKAALEAAQKVHAILEKAREINGLIEGSSTEYQFDRISRVEKNILRLGIYELLFDQMIPPKVAIAEAIRLCRKFGTPESSLFVNAILDGIYKKERGESLEESQKDALIQ